MSTLTAIIIGAGNRGADAYGFYAQENPDKLKILAIAEPNADRRNRLRDRLGLDLKSCFSDWRDLPEEQIADCAIIATMDTQHTQPAIHFMELGYDLLLEKPMAPNLEEAVSIVEVAERLGKKVMLAHVLRYSTFFQKLRQMIHSGEIGKIMTVEHKEQIGYYHFAHSYVRGNWRKESESAPSILAKCCHDLDLLYWLIGEQCASLQSFGMLSHFKKENQPEDASDRCTECVVEKSCPYSAVKVYMGTHTGWPVSVITEDLSYQSRKRALDEGPYGRCVYSCDNDVADHQTLNMSFGQEILVTMTMVAFTKEITRAIRIFGTHGEIRGHFEKNLIEVSRFGKDQTETISIIAPERGGHNGSDFQMMDSFVEYITQPNYQGICTTPRDSLESHLMAFAAEESRKEKRVVDMQAYRRRVSGLMPFDK